MTSGFGGRDVQEVDALATDLYIDALLATRAGAADRAAHGASRGAAPLTPGDAVQRTADRLARDLPRFHPSFVFEEALAARLADAASRMRVPAAVGAEGVLVPLAGADARSPHEALVATDEMAANASIGTAAARDRRPLIIGGALTSAAISIAGAAYITWRRTHTTSPMVRAARAVNRARLI